MTNDSENFQINSRILTLLDDRQALLMHQSLMVHIYLLCSDHLFCAIYKMIMPIKAIFSLENVLFHMDFLKVLRVKTPLHNFKIIERFLSKIYLYWFIITYSFLYEKASGILCSTFLFSDFEFMVLKIICSLNDKTIRTLRLIDVIVTLLKTKDSTQLNSSFNLWRFTHCRQFTICFTCVINIFIL